MVLSIPRFVSETLVCHWVGIVGLFSVVCSTLTSFPEVQVLGNCFPSSTPNRTPVDPWISSIFRIRHSRGFHSVLFYGISVSEDEGTSMRLPTSGGDPWLEDHVSRTWFLCTPKDTLPEPVPLIHTLELVSPVVE